MNEYQHSQTTTEIAAQAMRDKVNGANSRCSPPHGSAGALRADMLDLAMHCEKRAKTLDDMVKTAASAGYVSADWILDNLYDLPNMSWWEATLNGEHRQFVRIRLDIPKQVYVVDTIGNDTRYSEELWRYKGGDWQFLSHNIED